MLHTRIDTSTSVRRAADAYLEWLEQQVTRGTRARKLLIARRSAFELLGGKEKGSDHRRAHVEASGLSIADVSLGELKRSAIIMWLDAVALVPDRWGNVCPSRDHTALKALQALLGWCSDRDACVPGIASKIEYEYRPPPSRALHRAEFECFRAVLRARVQRADVLCLRVIADNGARPGEIRLARGIHFDAHQGVIRWPIGKGGEVRNIVLSPESINIIRAAVRAHGDGYLFPSHLKPGKPYSDQHLNRLTKDVARDADIERPNEVCVSDFRDSYATIAYEEGSALLDVSRALDHADTKTTLEYYLHNAVDPGARRVNQLINPPLKSRRVVRGLRERSAA